jgi:hypothetical protein
VHVLPLASVFEDAGILLRHVPLDECKGKGKFHPRTNCQGPEQEKRYNSTLSLTSAPYGVGVGG